MPWLPIGIADSMSIAQVQSLRPPRWEPFNLQRLRRTRHNYAGHNYVVLAQGHNYVVLAQGHSYVVLAQGHNYVVLAQGHNYGVLARGCVRTAR